MIHFNLAKTVGVLAVLGTAILATGACTSGISPETVAAKDKEISSLKAQVVSYQQDAKYWSQLTALLPPVPMPSMTDHRAYMLPSGLVLALHFDNLKLDQAQNLNWVALGIPGKFCKQDQDHIEAQFGKGFTHFHDMTADTHGGKPGAMGIWFVHVAAREFTAPWGPVKPGVDGKFMPTPAPACQ